MSKQDELILDMVAICNRHGIKSYQAVQVFVDRELMGKVVQELEIAESKPPTTLK
jgi:hypothetical protein